MLSSINAPKFSWDFGGYGTKGNFSVAGIYQISHMATQSAFFTNFLNSTRNIISEFNYKYLIDRCSFYTKTQTDRLCAKLYVHVKSSKTGSLVKCER